MNEFRKQIRATLADEEARYAYADTVTNSFVAAQIKALREDRGLSQEELAELIGTKQSGISRLERTDYSSWKIETLRKLATAFRVRLRIRFEGFGTLLEEIGQFDDKNLLPPRFEDDPVFIAQAPVHRRSPRKAPKRPRTRRTSWASPPRKPAESERLTVSGQEAAAGDGSGNNSTFDYMEPANSANNSVSPRGNGVYGRRQY